MLTVLISIIIFFICWSVNELYYVLPNIISFFIVVLAYLQYGVTSYNAKYDQWGDRLLWGISFGIFIYSYIFNWSIFMLVINNSDDMKTLFGVTVIIATPALAIIGPFKLAFDHFINNDLDDDLDSEIEEE